MQEIKAYIYDGNTKTRLEDLPPEAWNIIRGDLGSSSNVNKLYSMVSWLYRCVDIRANALLSMPFDILQSGNVIYEYDGLTGSENPPRQIAGWVEDLPENLKKTQAATVLGGRAYWERINNIMGSFTLQFHWLLPTSITPKFTRETGQIAYFERVRNSTPTRLEVGNMVYFWPPDHGVEIGPAINYPAKAVLNSAGIIHNLDLFLDGYFKRGLIKATLLKYKDQLSLQETPRVKEWWQRVTAGIANAFATEVVRGDFDVMTVGEGIDSLGDHTLTDKERENIATGMGVPQSKVAANAANFAVKQSDDVMFYEDTIIPEVAWIYKQLNKQIFHPTGFHIKARPDRLRVMQTDEHDRSGSWANYVSNGMSQEAAAHILGIDIPEDIELRKTPPGAIPMQLFAQPQGNEPTEKALEIIDILDKKEERDRFKRWLKNHPESDLSDFDSDYLTQAEKMRVAGKINNDYVPDPSLADLEIGPDDLAVLEAIRRFNRLNRSYRGLNDADVVG